MSVDTTFFVRLFSSRKKRALVIIDVQPAFVTARNRHVIKHILSRIRNEPYDCYIVSTFHASKGSIWDKQQHWTCPRGAQTRVLPEVHNALLGKHPVIIEKKTKSAFKGVPGILPILMRDGIEEIHIVGYDTNDYILATAYEAFDLGFLTYVIADCCESSSSRALHDAALDLLKHQSMLGT